MQQRYENARKVTKIEMGETERIMNKRMLLKLQSDPNIIRDIQVRERKIKIRP
jgi:hypothetical protein